jgi:hypothetical protein
LVNAVCRAVLFAYVSGITPSLGYWPPVDVIQVGMLIVLPA